MNQAAKTDIKRLGKVNLDDSTGQWSANSMCLKPHCYWMLSKSH